MILPKIEKQTSLEGCFQARYQEIKAGYQNKKEAAGYDGR